MERVKQCRLALTRSQVLRKTGLRQGRRLFVWQGQWRDLARHLLPHGSVVVDSWWRTGGDGTQNTEKPELGQPPPKRFPVLCEGCCQPHLQETYRGSICTLDYISVLVWTERPRLGTILILHFATLLPSGVHLVACRHRGFFYGQVMSLPEIRQCVSMCCTYGPNEFRLDSEAALNAPTPPTTTRPQVWVFHGLTCVTPGFALLTPQDLLKNDSRLTCAVVQFGNSACIAN